MQNQNKKSASKRRGTEDRSPTEKASAGNEIYESYLTRKSTFKWLRKKTIDSAGESRRTESEELVSFEKMQLMVDQNHPRIVINGKTTKIPLCTGIGNFSARKISEAQGFDQLGLGIS